MTPKDAFDINSIKKEQFVQNLHDTLAFGFSPKNDLWIKINLKNSTHQTLHKILEYDFPLIENIIFYDSNGTQIIDGTWQNRQNKTSFNPTLTITLKPYETKEIYIKVHSDFATLLAKLVLWNEGDFLLNNNTHITYLFIFFASLIVLFIYNFMLFVFTKEKVYFYYIAYLFGVMFFQGFYSGFLQFYLFSFEMNILVSKASMVYIGYLLFIIVVFTQEFLNTKQFPIINTILRYYIYTIPFAILISYNNFLWDLSIVGLYIPLAIVVVFTAFYSYFKGVEQAKFYMIGWSFVIVALVTINLKTIGLFDITKYFPYINEFAFLAEALLFSIALAHRIKILTEAKINSDKQLIALQKTEQNRLNQLVTQKTHDLQLALEQKDILYKELNHRVKNNLQMILSLVKLQISKTPKNETKEQLTITQNRIQTITKLYESLDLNNLELEFNTLSYFKTITNTISQGFQKEVEIIFDIQYNLTLENLIYCGLIINELVTNSFKYAFEKEGEITINLYKKEAEIYLTIKDNGGGFESKSNNNLGLIIVQNLVEKQLLGTMNIDTKEGTTVTICWSQNG
jgi:two-component system, sensor histidine kinase LadS